MRQLVQLLLITFTLMSCVGTIESGKPALSQGSIFGGISLDYEGIRTARAVSHDKVEITFPAMPGDFNGEYTYVVQYNSPNSPNFFKSNELQRTKDEFGNFKVTIYDLNINSNYNFSVQITDTKGNISINTKVIEVETFSNTTADFLGISSVKNLTGMDGAYGLRVEWVAAAKTGLIVPDITDVSKYEIKAVEEPLTPAAFDDPAFDGPQKKVVLVNNDKINAIINGLKPDTNYWVRVRAIHYGYDDNKIDPTYKREVNTKALKLKTYSLSATNISIQPASFIAASTNSNSSLDLSWNPAVGPFLNYRVYFGLLSTASPWGSYSSSLGASCDSTEDAFGWKCKQLPASEVMTMITDLAAYQNYQIALVACGNITCSQNQKYNVVTASPSPPLATFTGISSIEQPRHYYALDTIYLKFSPPDFTSGVVSGIYIKYMGRTTVNPIEPACILNDPTQACTLTSPYSIASFDFKTDTEVAVVGVDIDSAEPYCFKMIPYLEKDTGIEVANEESIVEKCISPTADIPNAIQFTGLINATKDASNYVTLEWTPPTGGIFTEYHIFVRSDQGTFNFNEAIAGHASYIRIDLPYGYETQSNGNIIYKVGPLNMSNGEFADFGVLVSKPDGSTRQFSQNYNNIRKITW